jgi:hypothetical protein
MTPDERELVRLWKWAALLSHQSCRPRTMTVRWEVRWRSYAVRGTDMALVLTTSEKVGLTIQPQDQYGNPARVDGIPSWGLSDDTIGSLTPALDGLSAEFVTSGALGLTQVNVQVDADLGGGVRPVVGTLDIQVEAAEAVTVGIVAGAPGPK